MHPISLVHWTAKQDKAKVSYGNVQLFSMLSKVDTNGNAEIVITNVNSENVLMPALLQSQLSGIPMLFS